MKRKVNFIRLFASLLIVFTLITVSTACKSDSNNNANSNNVSSNSSSNSNVDSNSNSGSAPDSSSDAVNNVRKLTKGADIRVMSYNILHPEWCSGMSYVSIVGRDTNLKNLINYYKPDVVGLQEACHPWHYAVDKYLVKDGDYAFACASTSTKPYNMTTMIYNKKTVKLIEEYVVDLDANTDVLLFDCVIDHDVEKTSDHIPSYADIVLK